MGRSRLNESPADAHVAPPRLPERSPADVRDAAPGADPELGSPVVISK